MFKLNKKGQASSTFQLLIAAIVALAILAVLLSVLDIIPILNVKEPSKATKTLLNDQINYPGSQACTDAVSFTKNRNVIATEAITKDTGLDKSQVYFDNPETIDNFNTEVPQLLKYTASSTKKVTVCVICSDGKSNLENAINLNKKTTDNFSQIPTTMTDDQTICVIYPRKTA